MAWFQDLDMQSTNFYLRRRDPKSHSDKKWPKYTFFEACSNADRDGTTHENCS